MERESGKKSVSKTFRAGAVCLAFLTIGYELSLFVHHASVERAAVLRDRPDTVYVIDSAIAATLLRTGHDAGETAQSETAPDGTASYAGPDKFRERGAGRGPEHRMLPDGAVAVKREAARSEPVRKLMEASRKVESFRFNPNTVTVDDLRRLGFSEKQAAAIDNYRSKGGRFRRKSDFAKSFVVADSVYRRLEKYIDIPLVDINKADSAAFDALPGIGGFFASKMVSYRKELGGYSYKEQLMDIWHFDREKYDGLSDLICCGPPRDSFALWELPVERLRLHPYVRTYSTARSIVFYREHNPVDKWTVEGLLSAGILDEETALKLSRCALKAPPAGK